VGKNGFCKLRRMNLIIESPASGPISILSIPVLDLSYPKP
jgi:hypothetical protein